MQLKLIDMIRRIKSMKRIQSGTLMTDPDCIDLINDAYQYYANICREKDYYVVQAPLYDLTANTTEYDFPSDFLSVKRFDRVDINPPLPIYRIRDQDVDQYSSSYPVIVNTAMQWYFAGINDSNGYQKFGLTQVPQITITDALRLRYDRLINPMADELSYPELPINFHELVPNRVLRGLGVYVDDYGFKMMENSLYIFLSSRNRQSSNDLTTVTDYRD